MVFDLRYSVSDNSLVAFTHGNGVYKVSLADINTAVTQPTFTKDFTQKIISNPVRENLSLLINSAIAGTAHFLIYDSNGKSVVSENSRSLSPGKNLVSVDVKKLSSGIYFLRTEMGKNVAANKFVVID